MPRGGWLRSSDFAAWTSVPKSDGLPVLLGVNVAALVDRSDRELPVSSPGALGELLAVADQPTGVLGRDAHMLVIQAADLLWP